MHINGPGKKGLGQPPTTTTNNSVTGNTGQQPQGQGFGFVAVAGTKVNPFGHAAAKVTDNAGATHFYDVNKTNGQHLVTKYTEQEFNNRYGGRNPKTVPVNVPNHDAAV